MAPRMSSALRAPPLFRCATHRSALCTGIGGLRILNANAPFKIRLVMRLAQEFLGSEPKFAEPSARPQGAAPCAAAKLVSDPNNSGDSRGAECVASLIHPARRAESRLSLSRCKSITQRHSALIICGTAIARIRSSPGNRMQKARVSTPSHSTSSPRMMTWRNRKALLRHSWMLV